MKTATCLTRTFVQQSWWRILTIAAFLAVTIYFLPIHHQDTDSFLVLSPTTAEGQPALTEKLPFGVQLLSFAKAQTTTLQLTKTGPAEAVQGGPIIYDLTISNTTATDAQQVRVVDYYPANTLTPTVIAPSGWFGGDDGTGTYGFWFTSDSIPFYPTPYSLPGNNSDTLRLIVNADSPLPNGTIITNAVYTATAANADPATVIGSPVVTTRIKAPEFGILNKTVTPTIVTPGNLLTYTLTLSNAGEYWADDVIITDTIPMHTSYVNAIPSAAVGSNVVTWTISRIEVAETAVLTLVVQTDPVITNNITINNTSYRAASTNVYTPAVGVDLAPATVSSQPALTITKTASAPTVEAGNLLTYRIVVTNQNSATDYAQNVQVVDNIPANTVFVDADFIVGFGAILSPTVGTNDPVTYNVNNPSRLNAGQSVVMSVTVRAISPLPNGTVITNTYGVSASNIAQPINGKPVTTTVTSKPQITLSKTVQPQVVLTNQPLEYTVTVTNSGNATAFNIPFTDTLPPGFTPPNVNRVATITGTDLSGTPGVVSFTIPAVSGFTGGEFPNVVTATVEGVDITTGPVATVTVVPEIFEIVKTTDHNPVTPGTPLVYTIAITNRTGQPQTAIITETYPGEVTYVTANPPPTSGDNIWNLIVPASGNRLITVTVNVNNPLNNGLAFTNTARVGNLVNPLVVQAQAANTVVSTPTLEVSKVGQPSVVEAGGLITYTIRYTNSGTMNATNVTVDDIYPTNTIYVSDDSGGSPIGGGRQWNVGTVAGNGGTGQLQLTLLVDTPLDNGTGLTNVVSTSADQPTTDVYTAFNTVNSAPILEITKQAIPDPVAPGATLTYTLNYTNSGNMNATGVIITDTLSGLVAYSSDNSGGTHDGSSYGGVITWDIGSLAGDGGSGSIEVTVVLTSPLTNGTSVENNFEIDSAQGVYNNGTLLTEVNAATDFNLTKSVSPAGTVAAGEQITYTLTAENLGNSNGVATTISDIIPPNTTFVAATSPVVGPPIIWHTNLPAGVTKVYTVVVQINTPLTNSAKITNAATIANTDDSATSNTVTTTVASTATLEITKLADTEPVQAGDTLIYTIQYTNTGTAVANNIVITDTLPLSVTFSNATTPPNSTPGNQLIWNVGSLSPADGVQSIDVTVVVTQPVISGSQIVNQVDIGANNAATATATATSAINSSPVWKIAKTPSSDPVTAGAALTYTITYTNVGNANATGVTITDTLDSGVSFVNATNGGAETSPGSGIVVWTIPGTVPANGAPGNVQVVVTVAATQPNGSLLTNNFEIISAQETKSTADSITTQVQAPVLTVTKTVSPNVSFVRAGDPIEYTITYSNLGPAPSNNIYITDTLPISVTNIVSSSAEATYFDTPSPGVVVWRDAVLGASSSGTITVQGQVITSPWAATGGQITNNVIVGSGNTTAAADVSTEGRSGLPFTVDLIPVPPTQQVGNNVLVMGSVEDAYGNRVYDGAPVTFSSSLAGSSVTPPATVNTSNGLVSAIVTSTAAGTTTVSAQTAGPVVGTTVVTFTAGPAVALELSATSPQTAGIAFPLTVTARDQYNNIATGFTDAITLTDSTGTISGGPVTMVNGTGVANVTITTAGPATITGTNGALTDTTDVVIQTNLADLQMALAADSPIRVCSSGTLTATLTDSYGNPAPGQTVEFIYNTSNFRPPSGATDNTDSNGVATLIVTRLNGSTITPDGVVAQWITDSGVQDNASVGTILPPNPGDVSINVSVSPGSIPADGSATSLLSANVQCGGYDAINGTVVDFSLAPQLGLSPTSPFTAPTSSGVATRTITAGTSVGVTTITGTVYSPAISDTTTLTLLQPAVLTVTKITSPASGTDVNPGDIITYTVQVENQGSTTATGVIITDDLDTGVGFVSASGSSNGSFSESSGQIVVTTPSLGIGESLTATWQVTVTAPTSGTLIENYANANSDTTGVITSNVVSHNVVTVPVTINKVFLPIIIKNCCLPNLVIQSFTVDGNVDPPLVTVEVRNAGQASTGGGFWVDVYVDPQRDPNTFNDGDRRWTRSAINAVRGIAWPVGALAAGDSITLVSTSGFDPGQTNWNWSGLSSGKSYRFVTFADSYDAQNNSYVEILESVENSDNQDDLIRLVTELEIESSSVELPPPQTIPPRRDLGR